MNLAYIFPQQLCLPNPRRTTQNRKPGTKPRQQRYRHRYIDVNELGRTVGCEFTFIAGGFDMSDFDNTHVARDALQSMAEGLRPVFDTRVKAAGLKVKKVSTDPQCVEVPTSPTNKRATFRKSAAALHDIAKALNMVGQNEWHGGGGAHIHVGMQVQKSRKSWGSEYKTFVDPALKVLLLDATARPYINWAFANPGDCDNTASTCCLLEAFVNESRRGHKSRETLEADVKEHRSRVEDYTQRHIKYSEVYRNAVNKDYPNKPAIWRRKKVMEYLNNDEGYYLKRYRTKLAKSLKALRNYVEPPPFVMDKDKAYEYMLNTMDKDKGITPRATYGTLEFRIFQAPNSAKEHELHLNFALAYVEWAEAQAKVGKIPTPVIMTEAERKAYPLDKAKKEFMRFVGMIGLKTRPYRRYLKNMERRYELVQKGLTYLH